VKFRRPGNLWGEEANGGPSSDRAHHRFPLLEINPPLWLSARNHLDEDWSFLNPFQVGIGLDRQYQNLGAFREAQIILIYTNFDLLSTHRATAD